LFAKEARRRRKAAAVVADAAGANDLRLNTSYCSRRYCQLLTIQLDISRDVTFITAHALRNSIRWYCDDVSLQDYT
jgi:hypothetical protein